MTSETTREAQMTRAEQEALSKRYAVAAIVTPLEDGTFAVFANDRTLESMVIVDDLGLAIAVRSRANRPGVTRKLPVGPQFADVNPDDLGI